MLKTIPEKLKLALIASGKMDKCCIADNECKGRIEWHHNFQYASNRVNEIWCILPVCEYHHSKEKVKEIGDRLDYVMLHQMTIQDEMKYPRVDWQQKRKYLDYKFKTTTR